MYGIPTDNLDPVYTSDQDESIPEYPRELQERDCEIDNYYLEEWNKSQEIREKNILQVEIISEKLKEYVKKLDFRRLNPLFYFSEYSDDQTYDLIMYILRDFGNTLDDEENIYWENVWDDETRWDTNNWSDIDLDGWYVKSMTEKDFFEKFYINDFFQEIPWASHITYEDLEKDIIYNGKFIWYVIWQIKDLLQRQKDIVEGDLHLIWWIIGYFDNYRWDSKIPINRFNKYWLPLLRKQILEPELIKAENDYEDYREDMLQRYILEINKCDDTERLNDNNEWYICNNEKRQRIENIEKMLWIDNYWRKNYHQNEEIKEAKGKRLEELNRISEELRRVWLEQRRSVSLQDWDRSETSDVINDWDRNEDTRQVDTWKIVGDLLAEANEKRERKESINRWLTKCSYDYQDTNWMEKWDIWKCIVVFDKNSNSFRLLFWEWKIDKSKISSKQATIDILRNPINWVWYHSDVNKSEWDIIIWWWTYMYLWNWNFCICGSSWDFWSLDENITRNCLENNWKRLLGIDGVYKA